MTVKKTNNIGTTALFIGIVAGTLDILLAILWYAVIQEKTTTLKILQSISSGVFGKKAYTGGIVMAINGLVLHYFISFCFAGFYGLIYHNWPQLGRQKLLAGILYGIIVWSMMNIVVLPLTFGVIAKMTTTSIITGLTIIVVAVGIPISYLTSKYNTNF